MNILDKNLLKQNQYSFSQENFLRGWSGHTTAAIERNWSIHWSKKLRKRTRNVKKIPDKLKTFFYSRKRERNESDKPISLLLISYALFDVSNKISLIIRKRLFNIKKRDTFWHFLIHLDKQIKLSSCE